MFSHGSPGVTLLVLALMYFIPSIIAFRREHRNATPIMALNIFLGWTVIGWVVALVWSLTASPAKVPA